MSVAETEQHEEEADTLPAGWRPRPLSELAQVIAGQSPPGHTYRKRPEGLPFFQGKADFGPRNPIARVWCVEPNKIAKQGDILISVRAPVGPTNVADQECCIGRGLAAIRVGREADADFLLYFLRLFEATLARKGSGSTFGAINRDTLESIVVPTPPLGEQRRIAAVLRERMQSVERARHAAEQELEAAGALVAAELRRVFPLHSDEDSCRLGDAASIASGVQKSPDRQPHSHHHPYLTVRNVQRGRLDLTRVERFEVTEAEFTRLRLQHDDILIVEGNGSLDHIGRNALFNGEVDNCIHQNHIIRVRCDASRLLPRFVSYFLNSPAGQAQMVEKARTSSGLYTLSTGKVASLSIPQKPLAQQNRDLLEIERFQTAAERIRSAACDQLRFINALPAALLREAFSGRL